MKYIISAIVYLVTFSAHAIDLKTALSQKVIACKIVSLGGHFGECIKVELENLTRIPIDIEQDYGLILINFDSTHQNLVLAQPLYVSLAPKQKVAKITNAFCISISKSAPMSNTDCYTVSEMSDVNLIQQLQIINKYKMFNYAGQGAIWAMQGCNAPENIEGMDSVAVMALRKQVCEKFRLPLPKYVRSKYVTPIDTTTELSIRYRGNFHLQEIKNTDKIFVAVYNANDSLIYIEDLTAIQKNEVFTEVRWEIELENLDAKQIYYMRIKVNDVIRKERVWDFHI